nr:hypothetical protein Iba_chr14dCG4800 [Ipomoea batatas]
MSSTQKSRPGLRPPRPPPRLAPRGINGGRRGFGITYRPPVSVSNASRSVETFPRKGIFTIFLAICMLQNIKGISLRNFWDSLMRTIAVTISPVRGAGFSGNKHPGTIFPSRRSTNGRRLWRIMNRFSSLIAFRGVSRI